MGATYDIGGRSGHSVPRIPQSPRMASMNSSCGYGRNTRGPETVLAVGTGVAHQIFRTVVVGLVSMFAGVGLFLAVLVLVLIRRKWLRESAVSEGFLLRSLSMRSGSASAAAARQDKRVELQYGHYGAERAHFLRRRRRCGHPPCRTSSARSCVENNHALARHAAASPAQHLRNVVTEPAHRYPHLAFAKTLEELDHLLRGLGVEPVDRVSGNQHMLRLGPPTRAVNQLLFEADRLWRS